jgi:hypothetical protein
MLDLPYQSRLGTAGISFGHIDWLFGQGLEA